MAESQSVGDGKSSPPAPGSAATQEGMEKARQQRREQRQQHHQQGRIRATHNAPAPFGRLGMRMIIIVLVLVAGPSMMGVLKGAGGALLDVASRVSGAAVLVWQQDVAPAVDSVRIAASQRAHDDGRETSGALDMAASVLTMPSPLRAWLFGVEAAEEATEVISDEWWPGRAGAIPWLASGDAVEVLRGAVAAAGAGDLMAAATHLADQLATSTAGFRWSAAALSAWKWPILTASLYLLVVALLTPGASAAARRTAAIKAARKQATAGSPMPPDPDQRLGQRCCRAILSVHNVVLSTWSLVMVVGALASIAGRARHQHAAFVEQYGDAAATVSNPVYFGYTLGWIFLEVPSREHTGANATDLVHGGWGGRVAQAGVEDGVDANLFRLVGAGVDPFKCHADQGSEASDGQCMLDEPAICFAQPFQAPPSSLDAGDIYTDEVQADGPVLAHASVAPASPLYDRSASPVASARSFIHSNLMTVEKRLRSSMALSSKGQASKTKVPASAWPNKPDDHLINLPELARLQRYRNRLDEQQRLYTASKAAQPTGLVPTLIAGASLSWAKQLWRSVVGGTETEPAPHLTNIPWEWHHPLTSLLLPEAELDRRNGSEALQLLERAHVGIYPVASRHPRCSRLGQKHGLPSQRLATVSAEQWTAAPLDRLRGRPLAIPRRALEPVDWSATSDDSIVPPTMEASGPLYYWSYIYYISKYYELLDTVLALLKGSPPPSFALHVFHHAVVLLMSWNWLQQRQSLQWIGLVANASVHVPMYWYYALRAAGVRKVWWKNWITRGQIVQFVSSFVALSFMTALMLMADQQGELAGPVPTNSSLLSAASAWLHDAGTVALHGLPSEHGLLRGVATATGAGMRALWFNACFNAVLLTGFVGVLGRNSGRKGRGKGSDQPTGGVAAAAAATTPAAGGQAARKLS